MLPETPACCTVGEAEETGSTREFDSVACVQDSMGPHPAERALAHNLKQPGPHARNVQAQAQAQMQALGDRDTTSQFDTMPAARAVPMDDRECFNSMQDIVRFCRTTAVRCAKDRLFVGCTVCGICLVYLLGVINCAGVQLHRRQLHNNRSTLHIVFPLSSWF